MGQQPLEQLFERARDRNRRQFDRTGGLRDRMHQAAMIQLDAVVASQVDVVCHVECTASPSAAFHLHDLVCELHLTHFQERTSNRSRKGRATRDATAKPLPIRTEGRSDHGRNTEI